ncbi:hypothetical protein SAMN05428949_3006 [Chitinophaga sp. YR627]|uniref:hypothetical protein n=1 Tax=Chitinophaga sp. YR627 TaxID=1881041 RepID=UPI0008DFA4F4|nr:hypothetical protein [Chitinophaga sp. YR627]SFN48741.1 hypothetical protein SAMN05428949_3006 [Chitinophaga sp. YR627]
MGLLKVTKDLFTVNETPSTDTATAEPAETGKTEITYQDYGYHQASLLGGSIAGLRVCLQKIYYDFKERIKNDKERQDELKKPMKVKLEEHKGDIERWENRIKKIKEEDLPALLRKIDTLKEDKKHIRENPQEIVGDLTGRPSFYIGCFILATLTVYLFVFYSSASYSTFFKEFKLGDIGVANAIFDAEALSNSLKRGITQLLLIITIPSVFLGLGYLIHKFQEEKGAQKYVKIATLILITFVFDGILAYEITEKIYDIKRYDIIDRVVPEYTIALAFHTINFWLIIFAGFIVYLIWGFVFDFVLAAHGKIDKVNVALKEKDKQIQDVNIQVSDLHTGVDKLTHYIDDAKTQIKKLQEAIAGVIIPGEFETCMYSFMAGWLAWMSGAGKSGTELDTAENIVREFIGTVTYTTPKIDDL